MTSLYILWVQSYDLMRSQWLQTTGYFTEQLEVIITRHVVWIVYSDL